MPLPLFETVDTPHEPVRFPGMPTRFSRTPGRVAGPAPGLRADTARYSTNSDWPPSTWNQPASY